MSKVSSKGQITLPLKVRKQFGVDKGDIIIFDFVGENLVIRKARNIENYFNSLPPLGSSYKEKLEEVIAADICGNQ